MVYFCSDVYKEFSKDQDSSTIHCKSKSGYFSCYMYYSMKSGTLKYRFIKKNDGLVSINEDSDICTLKANSVTTTVEEYKASKIWIETFLADLKEHYKHELEAGALVCDIAHKFVDIKQQYAHDMKIERNMLTPNKVLLCSIGKDLKFQLKLKDDGKTLEYKYECSFLGKNFIHKENVGSISDKIFMDNTNNDLNSFVKTLKNKYK